MPYDYNLSIAGITFQLESDHLLVKNGEFEPFLTGATEPDVYVVVRKIEKLPDIPDGVISVDTCYKAVADEQGNARRYFFETMEKPDYYAVATYDAAGKSIVVEYLEAYIHCVSEMKNCFFHLGFASVLLRKNRLCLHASCVDTELGGILFSGVSGIGKSTQAELWCRCRNARQINGDRPILAQSEEGWLAWGAPYAGSSRCYVNDCCNVSAIVMLRQEKQCSLRRLDSSEAFREVWKGLTIHSWDKSFVGKALDLTMDLIASVPVYAFGCTPDEEAVDYLERELQKEWNK